MENVILSIRLKAGSPFERDLKELSPKTMPGLTSAHLWTDRAHSTDWLKGRRSEAGELGLVSDNSKYRRMHKLSREITYYPSLPPGARKASIELFPDSHQTPGSSNMQSKLSRQCLFMCSIIYVNEDKA